MIECYYNKRGCLLISGIPVCSYYYQLGIVRQGRTRELVIAVEDVGVSGIEAKHELGILAEHHDAAFEDEHTGAVIEAFPVQRFALTEGYLDEFAFYHAVLFLAIPPTRA